jgi:uncharacterized protein YbjT (DUF2867 family)
MYAIMGAIGNTGNVIARTLLDQRQEVRAIGRSADRLSPLSAAGAKAVVCDATDSASLAKAFSGARAVYVIIPPSMISQDYRSEQDRTTESIASAIEDAGVKASAINSGHVSALEERSAQNTTPTSYESFVAEEFAPRYRAASASA